MVALEIAIASKRYEASQAPIIENCHIRAEGGEIVALVGPSGCGKSTLIKIVAGIDRSYEGAVRVGPTPGNGLHEGIGVVFQEPRLMPWMTVAQNIAFGAKRADLAVVENWLRTVGLQGAADKWPRELSGGMAQRVAFARAMVRRPAILLLDEPFSALDYVTRLELRQEFMSWMIENPTTVLLVTHDLEEAVLTSRRVFVMGGRPSHIRETLEIDRRGDRLTWIRRHIDQIQTVLHSCSPNYPPSTRQAEAAD